MSKFKTKKAQRQELIDVLQVALYDLHDLNRHDPLKAPRCTHRANDILIACGIEQIKMPNLPPLITAQEMLPQVVTLVKALIAEKPPVYRSPQVSFHLSNLVSYFKSRGLNVIPERTPNAARSSKKKTKVSKARKKIRSKVRSSKPKKRT